MNKLKYILAVVIAMVGLGLQQARADFSFNLNTANIAVPGPYATVDVHLVNSTTAAITFTSLKNSGNIYLFGGNGSVAVNVNATSWTLGSITGSNAGTGFTQSVPAGQFQFSNGGTWE